MLATFRRLVLLATFPALAAAMLLVLEAQRTDAQGNIDLSGSDWHVEVAGAVTLSCTANIVQNASAVSVHMDCPALGAGDFSGTIDQKSGVFTASGEILLNVSLSGTAAPDGRSFSGTWDAGFIGSGTFTGSRGVVSITPTATAILPTLPAPVDLSGTWRVTFSGIFTGECTSIIQQDGATLTSLAECDIIGSLNLTGTIDESTGKLTLADNGFVELHGVAAADGNSIAGTFSALDIVTGDFTAERDDSIELIDLTGDWHILLQGDPARDCSLHIEQSVLDATAQLECPGAPAVELTGTISPLSGFLNLQTESGGEFVLIGGRSSSGEYLQGNWLDGRNDGMFIAVPQGQDASGVLVFDCADYDGLQSSCSYQVGDSFAVQIYLPLLPEQGYSSFHVKLGSTEGYVRFQGTGTEACSGGSQSHLSLTSVTIDCDETRPGYDGVLASITLECEQPGEATLDLSGTTLTDNNGQPITPILIGGDIFCYAGQHGGPGLGDASCDGLVNSVDAAIVLQVDAGLVEEGDCLALGNVNHDGALNSIDAALILQYEAGLLEGFF